MFEGIGKAIGCLAFIAIIGIIGIFSFGLYLIYDNTGEQVFESKVIVKPEIKLTTNGKTIDTIYVYKFK
jgi:hypothetical protein